MFMFLAEEYRSKAGTVLQNDDDLLCFVWRWVATRVSTLLLPQMSSDHLTDVFCATTRHELLRVLLVLAQGVGWSCVFMHWRCIHGVEYSWILHPWCRCICQCSGTLQLLAGTRLQCAYTAVGKQRLKVIFHTKIKWFSTLLGTQKINRMTTKSHSVIKHVILSVLISELLSFIWWCLEPCKFTDSCENICCLHK